MNKLSIQKLNILIKGAVAFLTLSILAFGFLIAPEVSLARETCSRIGSHSLCTGGDENFDDSDYDSQYSYENTDSRGNEPRIVNNYNYTTNYAQPKAQPASSSTKSANTNTQNTQANTSNSSNERTFEPVKTTEDASNLAANVIFGSGGFLPTGILDWILVAILILVIVILARKIFGGENRYHSEPLKHA